MDNLESNTDNINNYSKYNGDIIKQNNMDDIVISKIKENRCSNCNTENNDNNNYCKVCGKYLYDIKNTKQKYKKINNTNFNNILQGLNIKNITLTALLSVLILLVVSLVIKVFISIDASSISTIINPLHIVLAFNIGELQGYSSSILGSGATSIKIGMIIILLIPFISLFISNKIFMRKEIKDLKDLFINSVCIGILYSIILLLISFISNIRLGSNDILQYGISLSIKYRGMSILLNGFFIGFISTYVIGFKKEYKSQNAYLNLLKISINTVFIGYISSFIIMYIFELSDSGFLYELGFYSYFDNVGLNVMLSQASAYVWMFANLIPVSLNNIVSVFSLLNSDLLLYTKLIFGSMIALSFIILLITGCLIKQKYYKNDKIIIIFSMLYALVMGGLCIFTKIYITGNISLIEMNSYKSSISMGSNVFIVILISFIYSTLVSGLGYRLYQREE